MVKALIVCLLAALSLARAATMISGVLLNPGQTLPNPSPNQIEFKVAFDHQLQKTRKEKGQWQVAIYCSLRNISREPVEILLKDHDSFHGTLAYVYGTSVRIAAPTGIRLTSSYGLKDGWWDFSQLSSQLSHVEPGDIVTLKPGESVVRRFTLEDLLNGLTLTQAADKAPVKNGSKDLIGTKTEPFAFAEGDFTIEVKLGDLIAINKLSLTVKEKSE